jgi:Type III flagellar switch regulator (C-ring) FliN C-term
MPDAAQPDSSPASETPPTTEPAAVLPGAFLMQSDSTGNPTGPLSSAARPFPEGSPLAGLPMQLDVTIPIPSFRVQDLLALEKDAVLDCRWPHAEDVPVWCGGVQLVWSEFEVVGQKLAVRVTRLT